MTDGVVLEKPQKAQLSEEGQRYAEHHERRFYVPGVTPGQPFKEDEFRYCYTFFKKMGKVSKRADIGDKFDYFLFKAD